MSQYPPGGIRGSEPAKILPKTQENNQFLESRLQEVDTQNTGSGVERLTCIEQ